VEDEALRVISKSGYDLQYGARPLRRAIQRMVEDSLSEEILLGSIKLGDRVRAYVEEDALKFKPAEAELAELDVLPAGDTQ
jgi:ATP-dependent Clp protease ATP-binding subunit ClpC